MTVDASGANVAYRSGGSQGPVVLLLHGISSGAPSWLPCASLLAAHARVIAWDAPGYGSSSPLAQKAPRAADYAVR
ncbi:alpha/beta hydrolase, partial [Acinetobacter baumannii]